MSIYNIIGKNYTETRQPDKRIMNALLHLLALPKGSLIADIGAGTGNYTNAFADHGFRVIAVEPSSVMRAQAVLHSQVQWCAGVAEHLPLREEAVDGVVSTLAIHHFSQLRLSLREMDRVAGLGPLLLFTFDYTVLEKPWVADYFPKLWEEMSRPLPPLRELATWMEEDTTRHVEVVPFLLPADLTDMFMLAAWQHPQLYLDPQVRAGISTFALANPADVNRGVERLKTDLENGQWNAKYGWLREQQRFDAGYRFLCATKQDELGRL